MLANATIHRNIGFRIILHLFAPIILLIATMDPAPGQSAHHTVRSADGTTIGFTRIGNGPVPVVLVHGALNSGEQWLPVAAAMSDYCTCYVMDRWGRGGSDNRTEYSLEREAEDIVAVLETAGSDAFLLGHSSGAIYALEAALLTSPAGLILYEPPIHAFHGRFVEHTWVRIRSAAEAEQYEDMISIFLIEEAEISDDELAYLRTTPAWGQMNDLAPVTVREWAELVRVRPAVSRYRDVALPTLLLAGTETLDDPSFATQALNDILPDARTVTLHGQGHFANVSAPELVASEIVRFLAHTVGAVMVEEQP